LKNNCKKFETNRHLTFPEGLLEVSVREPADMLCYVIRLHFQMVVEDPGRICAQSVSKLTAEIEQKL